MCNASGIDFVRRHISANDVYDKRVLEVGSRDVNGSVRPMIESLGPSGYVGVDIAPGTGVDELCDAVDLCARFGEDAFDLVVSTELVEHVKDWRTAIDNMKKVLKPQGEIVVTTRSPGFKIHGYPWDYWRYEPGDLEEIFSDFDSVEVERDREAPGVFISARKPRDFRPTRLDRIALHSVITGRRSLSISSTSELLFKLRHRVHLAYRWLVPEAVRSPIKRLVLRTTRKQGP